MAHDPHPRPGFPDPLGPVAEHPSGWALFLDIDGTLLDLAPTPDAIVVPPFLPPLLTRLSVRLGGALALVTGRALPYADALFSPARFPIAGLHGAERRGPDGQVHRPAIPAAFESLKHALDRRAAGWDGVLIEDKGAAVGAHYRQAPQRQGDVEALMREAAVEAGADWTLQFGKMVVELRPARASKGDAVRAFLDEPPFKDRRPVAIGDDVTDEAMFEVANALGGYSIRIGPAGAPTVARTTIDSVAALRMQLFALAGGGD